MKYEVKSGDSLSKIARNFNMDYKELARLNKIADPDKIRVGQVISVPTKDMQAQVEAAHLGAIPKAMLPRPATNRAATRRKARAARPEPKPEPKPQRQKAPEPKEERESLFSFSKPKRKERSILPENANAFISFLVGNKLGVQGKGKDIDVANFGEEQKEVLRQAIANARADGRTNVQYKDYPTMKDGQIVEKFYKKQREDTNYFQLAKASFQDPVFEMFTTLGAFNFKDLGEGRSEILPDRYDFSKAKSGGKARGKAKDAYGTLTYLGQDISENQTFDFNIKGIV